MTPFFTPEALPTGPPRLFLAGVGPAMTRVAGEVADGFFVHPFCTPSYLDAVTRPALAQGTHGAAPDFEIAWPVMIATGMTDQDRRDAEFATRAQIAFYGSTPAYRPVLDHHDRGELQPVLRARSQEGDWAGMAELVDDELFDLIAIRGTPAECGAALAHRSIGRVQRVGINAPYASSGDPWPDLLKAFHRPVDLNRKQPQPGPS
jgi:probable F420-dependent oxidoreductase